MRSTHHRPSYRAPLFLFLFIIIFITPAHRSRAEEPRGGWPTYRTILWLSGNTLKQSTDTDALLAQFRAMGINTAMVSHGGDSAPFVRAGFPFYVENIVGRGLCLKYRSNVTDWSRFIDGWSKERSPSAFIRDYSLDDPTWLNEAIGDVRSAVKRFGPHQPVAYDLRDELSTTISANPFDYDFSPPTLDAFRAWLKTQYRDLAALNAEWDTYFPKWDDVKPFSTDQIKIRMAGSDSDKPEPDWSALKHLTFDPAKAVQEPARWNFAPWCDFRTYMDVSLARALGALRDASHTLDPHTPVGIEGTQMPSAWGGYDLWRLSQVLDWVEPYDVGNAREIWASFMPGKPVLTTVGEKDARAARRRLWHLLLQGDRGCIVWWSEDCIAFKDGAPTLTPRAQALAPVLREMTSPLAALFLRAKREYDMVGIHYSQPSIQVDWLLESIADGRSWPRRFSSFEATHNRFAQTRNGWLKALQDLGYSPRFVSSEQIGKKELDPLGAFVLPESSALSLRESALLTAFSGHAPLLVDGPAGAFDAHGRLLPHPPSFSARSLSAQDYARERLQEKPASDVPAKLREALAKLPPPIPLDPAWRVALHRYQLGPARLLAFERNIDYHMSEELKQAGGNEQLEKPVTIHVTLPSPGHVYDLRTGKYLGQLKELTIDIDPWAPSLFALFPERPANDDPLAALKEQP